MGECYAAPASHLHEHGDLLQHLRISYLHRDALPAAGASGHAAAGRSCPAASVSPIWRMFSASRLQSNVHAALAQSLGPTTMDATRELERQRRRCTFSAPAAYADEYRRGSLLTCPAGSLDRRTVHLTFRTATPCGRATDPPGRLPAPEVAAHGAADRRRPALVLPARLRSAADRK